MMSEIQNEIEQRIRARALWDEFDQMSKEAIGFGAVKKVMGLFKAAPKKPVLSPVEQMAKKFMADPKAFKSVRSKAISPAQRAAESRISEAYAARPGHKYASVKAVVQDLAERRVKIVSRQHDVVEAEPGSIHLTKASARSLLRAARVGSRLLRRRATHVGRTTAGGVKKYGPGAAKAGLLGGGLAVGGTALGASTILRQHAQQQMGRTIPMPYRPA